MAAASVNSKRENPFYQSSFEKKGRSQFKVLTKIKVKEVFSSFIKHSVLLQIAQSMGYDSRGSEEIEQGCCRGITTMGNFAILIGEVENFNDRLRKIKGIYDLVVSISKHQKAEQIQKTGEILSKDLDVRSFFDGVVFSQSGMNGRFVLGLDGREASKKTLDSVVYSHINSLQLEKLGGAEISFLVSLMGDFHEMIKYLSLLIEFFDSNNASACINFMTLSHARSMGYDNRRKLFIFNDSNFLLLKEFSTLEEISEVIFREITEQEEPDSFDTSRTIVVGLEIVSIKGALKGAPRSFLETLSETEIKEKARYKGKESESLAAIASAIGDYTTLRKLIEIQADVKGTIPIRQAAAYGRLDFVKMILEGPRAKMEHGMYGMHGALKEACSSGHLDVVKYFVELGLNILGKNGYELISMAAKNGHASIVKFLIEKKVKLDQEDDSSFSLLHLAIYGGSLDVVRMLITAGCDVNSKGKKEMIPLIYAAKMESSPYLASLLDSGAEIDAITSKGMTALMMAAKNGKEDCVSLLIARGADITLKDFQGRTAFSFALESQNEKVILLFLNQGLDINERDSEGNTALYKTALQENRPLMEMLIKLGADKDARDYKGHTILERAILDQNRGVIAKLIQSGFDLTTKDPEGRGALLFAISFSNLEMVRFLIDLGANPFPEDSLGRNVFDYAIKYRKEEIFKFLSSFKDAQYHLSRALGHIANSL